MRNQRTRFSPPPGAPAPIPRDCFQRCKDSSSCTAVSGPSRSLKWVCAPGQEQRVRLQSLTGLAVGVNAVLLERAYLVAFCAGRSEFVFGLYVSAACGLCAYLLAGHGGSRSGSCSGRGGRKEGRWEGRMWQCRSPG